MKLIFSLIILSLFLFSCGTPEKEVMIEDEVQDLGDTLTGFGEDYIICLALATKNPDICYEIPNKEEMAACKEEYCSLNTIIDGIYDDCIEEIIEPDDKQWAELFTQRSGGSSSYLDVAGCDYFQEEFNIVTCKAAAQSDITICDSIEESEDCKFSYNFIIAMMENDLQKCDHISDIHYRFLCKATLSEDEEQCNGPFDFDEETVKKVKTYLDLLEESEE